MTNLIVIPARIGSSRLARKMLRDISGKTLILRVLEQALQVKDAECFVATDSEEIFNEIESHHPSKAIMTSNAHQSGTDRVYEAQSILSQSRDFEHIVNLQGDLPFIEPHLIEILFEELKTKSADIVTLGAPFSDLEQAKDPACVKIVRSKSGRALYFSRSPIPHYASQNEPQFLHHIGIYGFSKKSLTKFINLPQSHLEKIEKLEQLRALENDMSIVVREVSSHPLSVDTETDLEKAKKHAI